MTKHNITEQAECLLKNISFSPECRTILDAALKKQQSKGFSKYGQALQSENGRDASQDLLEELIDATHYMLQVKAENKKEHEKNLEVCYNLINELKRIADGRC